MTSCVDTAIMAPDDGGAEVSAAARYGYDSSARRGLERYLGICGRFPVAILLSVALGVVLAAAFRQRSDVFFAFAAVLLASSAIGRLARLRCWANQRHFVMRAAFYRIVLVVVPVALACVVGTSLAVGARQAASHWSVFLSIGLGTLITWLTWTVAEAIMAAATFRKPGSVLKRRWKERLNSVWHLTE